ncbi:MAG TPA: hypothetical protein VLF21_02510 [Candidatus Saccharimonadales bacterium]|nr:hypothetical protein [Candidatus Saccharimonadales bacterium]
MDDISNRRAGDDGGPDWPFLLVEGTQLLAFGDACRQLGLEEVEDQAPVHI